MVGLPDWAKPLSIELDVDVPAEQPTPKIQTIRVEVGESPKMVGGAAGWYGGDSMSTTSVGGYEKNDGHIDANGGSTEGIKATATEGAAARARRLFGIDFTYRLEPGYRVDSTGQLVKVPNSNYIVRNDNDFVVTPETVTNRYGLLQPSTLDIIDDVLEDAEIDRGGQFGNGRTVWLQTRSQEIETPSGPMVTRIMVSNACDGTGGFKICPSGEVIECKNIYRAVLKKYTFSIRHTIKAQERLTALRNAFQSLKADGKAFKEAQAWMFAADDVKVNDRQVLEFLRKVFPVDNTTLEADADFSKGWASGKTQASVDRFMDAYKFGDASKPGTVWGLAQAVTNYTSHLVNVRKTNQVHTYQSTNHQYDANRFASIWNGSAGHFEDKAVQHLHVMVQAA
jgi:hypothetical protein